MIPDWFLTILYLFIVFLMLTAAGFVLQLVIERFLVSTLPILAELVNRIKNPNDYK